MTKTSNVPRDSAEEMLSKIPMKSLGTVPYTYKKCSALSKVGSFAKKKLGRQGKVAAEEAMESMADLPTVLAEEVLCRIPMKDLRSVRSTCKTWNTLLKDRSFAKRYLGRQVPGGKDKFMLVLMLDYTIYLMSIDLSKNDETFMNHEGTLISLDDSDQFDVSQVFHCEGLLLCIFEDNTRLVVWNPYLGQTRWIKPEHNFEKSDLYTYALGYDKSSNSHKILSFVDYKILEYIGDAPPTGVSFADYKIYDFNSDSWRVLDVTPDVVIDYNRRFSLKGNTYWLSKREASGRDEEDACLLSFDFTRERFGPRLPLSPFDYPSHYQGFTLSSVREEQLAILVPRCDKIRIWVTTKIEPDEVSWSSKVFLSVRMTRKLKFPVTHESFFIDEETQVAVVFSKEGWMNVAYIVGVDGSINKIELGESPYRYCLPSVCSYVPSVVQLN